jgi:transglutaminase-like putative cysteine protease
MTAPARAARWWKGLGADPTITATVALALVTLAVGLGFGRLFSSGPFAWPVIVTVVMAHGTAYWCRRNEIPTGVAACATLGAAAVATAWTVLGHTTAYGVPIPYTLRVAAEEINRAREIFDVVRAPTPVLPGFLVALTFALGVASFMADWAAFRLQTAIEALVPAFTLFVFTSALGTEHHRWTTVVAFAATALGFLLVFGMTTKSRLAWFGGRPANGPATLWRAAAVLAATAIVGGLLVGPALPGANADPIVKIKGRGSPGPSSRSTISPLVDIRGRLIERADVEVFTVTAEQRTYWRLTSLDTFDGSIWSSNTTYRPTRGGLGTDERLVGDLAATESAQDFTIRALDSIWLPAAFRPMQVAGIEGVSYNPDTASLITEDETTDGYTYTVRSAIPTALSPEQLDTAPARAPAEVADRYLALPDVSDRVEALARRIVEAHPTPYRRAKALQDFFHKGDFTYSLSERQGHDSGALENFLLRSRRGYCEQFAGAYAVMARIVGLPTRVAVGFTPGDLGDDGVYHVRDEHAHAWPEVYLEGFGWTQFEPTVGRGAPNAESWTGRPEAQDASGTSTSATTATTPATSTPNDQVPPTSEPVDPGFDQGPTDLDQDDEPNTGLRVVAGLAALALAWAIVVPLLHLARRLRRRRVIEGHATAPPRPGLTDADVDAEVAAAMLVADRVLAAWADAAEALERAGVRRRPAETLLEFSGRAPASAGLQVDAATALRTLCRDTALISYAPSPTAVDGAAGDRARASADAIRGAVLTQLTLRERVVWWLDPRPLLREWKPRRQQRLGATRPS